MKQAFSIVALILAVHLFAPRVESGKGDEAAVRELKLGMAAGAKFKPTTVKTPTVITAADEAAKLFDDDSLALIKKSVNFDKEKLLVFSWAGSGGDRIRPEMEKKDGKATVVFHYKAGLTDDVRRHFHVFVLPKDAAWSVVP